MRENKLAERMKLYGIWCYPPDGTWLREQKAPEGVDSGILAFESRQRACDRAAREFGFATYAEAKRKGWVEVRLLSEGK